MDAELVEETTSTDPDLLLKTLFIPKPGRPLSAWKNLKASFPHFAAKSLTQQGETLKKMAAGIAYLKGAEALESSFQRKKVDPALFTAFGICFDKVNASSSDDLLVKIPARLLGSYSTAIVIRPTPTSVPLPSTSETT